MRQTPNSITSAPQLPEGVIPLDDIIGWDVGNWSKCLSYWQPWFSAINKSTARVLVLGERNGGISLWFALQGFNVLCTDYVPLSENVRRLHMRWQVQERINYASADVFRLVYKDNYFDIVACKSVIGGLLLDYKDASTRTLENQKLAVEEIRRVIKPAGIFLGAENLTGTSVHMALRKIRLKGRLGWRYLQISEIEWLFKNYSACEQKPYGCIGTYWPRSSGLNVVSEAMDRCFSKVLPGNWLYISFVRARK
jgi:SAM-dependent methyltransferase